MADDWPLQSFLELGALAGAVPCARLHTRHVLWEWGLTALRDDAELLVSELVTNAVHASRSMEWIFPVRMRLLSDRAQVAIVVWDANPQPPVRTEAGQDDEKRARADAGGRDQRAVGLERHAGHGREGRLVRRDGVRA